MIDLYTYPTPNGRKVAIMLEECALDYQTHVIDIFSEARLDPEFRKISPAQRIPAIVDSEGPAGGPIRVFETAAILQYLADKTGRFRGNDAVSRLECSQWLQVVVTSLAPAFREAFVFTRMLDGQASEEARALGRKRFEGEVRRFIGVLDFRLREYEYLAKTYTIADMAAYPWIAARDFLGIDLDDFVGVRNWFNRLEKRPAVKRGMAVPPAA